jgi:threonyl-tRNA synthetase
MAEAKDITITLPDGSTRTYPAGVEGTLVAGDIGPGLLKAALAMRLDGVVVDLYRPIEKDADVAFITTRDEDEALDILRHDCAHVMAQAVQELFPGTQATIGPNIENGFFYDFARETPFSVEDLAVIEARMREIVKRDLAIQRQVWDRAEAIKYFNGIGETYKAEIIADLPGDEDISVYQQGEWKDLCRGPHLPSTGKLGKGFKLMKVAGAYWRGDSRNEMLTRIYGTCWRDKKELNAYLTQLEEAEKRDHRKIGRQMDLFHFQEEAAGMVFWHQKGWALHRQLETYLRAQLEKTGYDEIKTPILADRKLWEQSGHWEKFHEHMYISEQDDRMVAVKPMNCPCHVQVYKQGIHSYRDLPLRLAEFGTCHRFEPSGALHGLMRVRGFLMDDAHIFCTEEQIIPETRAFCALLFKIYKDLGFTDVKIKFSDRPEVRAGSDEVWDKAEAALKEAVEATGMEYTLNPGEGAFYGPKLEFVLRDAIGRDWQCGTWQIDFVLPERLDATYIGEDGAKHRPAMLHRAILGSFERFIGILIEHYEGKFPLWLAPQQAVVATITQDGDAFANEVMGMLQDAGLRARADLRNEKINYKVREHSLAKVPVMLVIGKIEAAGRSVSIRRLGSNKQESLPVEVAIQQLVDEAKMPQ